MTEVTHHTPEVITLPREMVVNDSLAGEYGSTFVDGHILKRA